MTELNVNLNTNIKLDKDTAHVVSPNKSANEPLPFVKKLTIDELCQKLGITKQQYDKLLLENKDLSKLDLAAQAQYIENLNKKDKTEEKSVEINSPKDVALTAEDNKNANINTSFDRAKFKRAGADEKVNILIYELAKNEYMYGRNENGDHTEEQWNALSDGDKQKQTDKIRNKIESYIKKYLPDGYSITDKDKARAAAAIMTELQVANSMKFSLKSYEEAYSLDDKGEQKKKEIQAEKDANKYNYLSGISDKSTLSRSEELFLKKKDLLKASVDAYYKNKTGRDSDVCIEDLDKAIEESGANRLKIQYDYLVEKEKAGNLTKFEKKQLKALKGFVESDIYKASKNKQDIEPAEDNVLARLNGDQKYNKILENSDASAKAGILVKALDHECKDDKKLFKQNLSECIKQALKEQDYELVQELSNIANRRGLKVSENDSAVVLTARAKGISSGNAVAMDSDAAEFKDQKLSEAFRIDIRKNAAESQMLEISAIKTDNTNINNATFDMGTRANDLDIGKGVYDNLRKNAGQDTLNYAASNADKAQNELQNYVLTSYTEGNKEATKAAIDSGTVTRFAKENQTEGMHTLKVNAEATMEGQEAIDALTTLASQIPQCDKDNQLDMHNDIMTSKYSEVQKYAASQISKLDPTVQAEAIQTAYATGNESVIAAASAEVVKCAPDVQQLVAPVIVVQNAMNSDSLSSDDKFKLLNSINLTSDQIAKLSPKEKQEYFTKLFKQASISDKMKMLSTLSGAQQKSAYTLICRYYPEILSSMVEGGKGKSLLDMGLPIDINNKIIGLMKRSTNIQVITQLKEIQADSKFKDFFKDMADKNSQGIDFVTSAFATSPKELKNKKVKGNIDLRV